jgi:hypothetical protein
MHEFCFGAVKAVAGVLRTDPVDEVNDTVLAYHEVSQKSSDLPFG